MMRKPLSEEVLALIPDGIENFILSCTVCRLPLPSSRRTVDLERSVVRVLTVFFGRLNAAEFVGLGCILATGFWLYSAGEVSLGACSAAALFFAQLFNPINLALGLFDDLVWGGRLGLWGLGLLAAYGLVLVTRNMMSGQSRVMMWVWYGAAWTVCMGAALLAVLAETHNAPNLLALAGQWLPTLLLYPAADRLIVRFEDADPRFR